MIRWSLSMVALPSGSFSSLRFDGAHDEPPSFVAMPVNDPDRSSSESMAETQPKL